MKNKKLLSYSNYLQLDKILSGQELMSAKRGAPAHDEMLFIIVHQVYELWFKQILHELDSVIRVFKQKSIIESDISFVVLRLNRIIEIQKILIDQIRVLETMTAMDFLEFRDDLFPSSGFQSAQFRLMENKLGLMKNNRIPYGRKNYTSVIEEKEKPIVKNSEIVVGNTMKLTLACDHRTVDGATGSLFLKTLKDYIENPVSILI